MLNGKTLSSWDIEQMILIRLADGQWRNRRQIKAAVPDCDPDMFWGRMSHLYKTAQIERDFDVYGEAIYRITPEQ
jgi:hypothetical protein